MSTRSSRAACALLALALCAGASAPALLQEPEAAAPAAAGPTPARAKTADLAWMSGHWIGTGLGGEIEEIWSQPAGGSLMGMFRLVAQDRAKLYEFLLVEEGERGVEFRFKHFNRGYQAWEKDGPLSFVLVDSAPGRAVFESTDPEQSPARMIYHRTSEDGLAVVVENPEAISGPRSFEVVFRRARPDAR